MKKSSKYFRYQITIFRVNIINYSNYANINAYFCNFIQFNEETLILPTKYLQKFIFKIIEFAAYRDRSFGLV